MNKGRLFTFGCSMTQYCYPTWADILGRNWEHFENWGDAGSGNTLIFNSVIECDQLNSFNDTDTLLILWTGLARIDYYQFGKWRHIVNTFPKPGEVNPVHCPDGYELTSYSLMTALHQYLDSKGVNYTSMAWQDYDLNTKAAKLYKHGLAKLEKFDLEINKKQYAQSMSANLIVNFKNLYSDLAGPDWPTLEEIATDNYNVDEKIKNEINEFIRLATTDKQFAITNKNYIDYHPLPTQHLSAVRRKFPNIKLSPDIDTWINDIENQVISGKNVNFDQHKPKNRL